MSLSGGPDPRLSKLNFSFTKGPKYPADPSSQSPRPPLPTASIPFTGSSRPFRRSLAKPPDTALAAPSLGHENDESTSSSRDLPGGFLSSISEISTRFKPLYPGHNHDGPAQGFLPDSATNTVVACEPSHDAPDSMAPVPPSSSKHRGTSLMQERILRLKRQRESSELSFSPSGSVAAQLRPPIPAASCSIALPEAQLRLPSGDSTGADSPTMLDETEGKPLFSSAVAPTSGASLPHSPLLTHSQIQVDTSARIASSVSASPAPSFASNANHSASQLSVFADALRSAESWMIENQTMAATIRELESRCGSQEATNRHLEDRCKDLEKKLVESKEVAAAGLKRFSAALEEMGQELDSLRTAVPSSGVVDLAQMLDDIAQLRRQSSDAQSFLKPFFDLDGNCNFKLRDVQQLLKEAQDEIEVLSRDNNNKTEVLEMVRDRLKTATGELVEQKERTNQLETLNARHAEQLQALSENFAQAGADFSLAKSANDDLVALRAQVTTLEHQLNDTEGMANDLRIRLRNQEKSSKEELDKALARASELQQHLTATKTQLQSRSQSYDEVSVQLDALRESESNLKHKIQLLTEYEAEVMQLRITKAENACIPSLRARIEELLGSKTSLETEVEALRAIYTDLGRLRGVELQFALANGQIANLEDQVKTLQTNLSLEQEKAIQCTTLKESAVSEAEKLVARIESATIANQESMTRIKLLEQEVQQQAAELARKEKEYINTISQSKTEVDRKEEIIASFSHEIDKAAKATSKVQSELASVQSKLADAEKLSAVTAAKLDSADSTISDLREQHTGLMTQNTSLASELASLKARESETNLTLRSVVVEKDEIREKLAERNSAISQCRTDIARLTSQLEESQSKMEEYRETARLVPELQRHISDSQHQLDTFASRYRAGRELSEAECAVVKDVMETCQRSLEQQLVAKGNDIRRRDNTIKSLESRIKSLESQLAKQLDSKAKANAHAGAPQRTLIDLNGWMSSSPSGVVAFDVLNPPIADTGQYLPVVYSPTLKCESKPDQMLADTPIPTKVKLADIDRETEEEVPLECLDIGGKRSRNQSSRSQENMVVVKKARTATRSVTKNKADQERTSTDNTESTVPKPETATSKMKGKKRR